MESSSLSGTSEWIINVPGNKIYPIRKAIIITYDEEAWNHKENANDYATHLYVYTLFIYIDKGIMRKFGVE